MELANYTSKLPPISSYDAGRGSQNRSPANESNMQLVAKAPNKLNSLQHHSGVIDTWPAHSANQRPVNYQMSLNKNNRLVVRNTSEEGKVDITPKPKFLENLESYLNKELKALGAYDTHSNGDEYPEMRLQAFREVFEYLIEEFKTYKPLLSSIKNEYEIMLEHQRNKIRELEPLRGALVAVANECEKKLMDFREEEKNETKALKQEKKNLLDKISSQKQDILSLQAQVQKLHEELVVEHEHYRDEHDKKKLLISDLNDLRAQQEEAKLAELQREKKRAAEMRGEEAAVEENENDDPVTLKLALKVCRQNLTDAMKRLTKMEADYGDVIPRRDYVYLETVFNELTEKHKTLEKDFKQLKTENSQMKSINKQMEAKLSEALGEWELMKATSTPRPDWDKCGMVIDGGNDRWKVLSSGKSSNQLVEILLNELVGGNSSGGTTEFFIGKGISEDIPLYLRCEGEIKNRNLNKRDAALTVYEIWKERVEKYHETENPVPMSEFVFHYFKTRFPSNQLAYEWCYGLNDACERYIHNEQIQFFRGVLLGIIDENIYHHERRVLSELLNHFVESAFKEGTEEKLSRNSFQNCLKSYFKFKKNDDIEMLVKAAEEELNLQKDSPIEFSLLMSEDDEGKTGAFLTALKSQMKSERSSYNQEIKNLLAEKSHISINDFKRTVSLVDQNISEKEIDRYIQWCFGVSKQDQVSTKTIDTDELIKKLDNCNIYKHDSLVASKN